MSCFTGTMHCYCFVCGVGKGIETWDGMGWYERIRKVAREESEACDATTLWGVMMRTWVDCVQLRKSQENGDGDGDRRIWSWTFTTFSSTENKYKPLLGAHRVECLECVDSVYCFFLHCHPYPSDKHFFFPSFSHLTPPLPTTRLCTLTVTRLVVSNVFFT